MLAQTEIYNKYGENITQVARKKLWIDINRNMIHPISKNLLLLQDIDSVRNSLMNIIMTEKGSRVFDMDFGTRLGTLLFENIDEVTLTIIEDEVRAAVRKYEPRVLSLDITTHFDPDHNSIAMQLVFLIGNGLKGTLTQTLNAR